MTVANAAPTAQFVPDAGGMNPMVVKARYTRVTDPSPADLAAGLQYSFSLSPPQLATSYAQAGRPPERVFVFPQPGTYTVSDGSSTRTAGSRTTVWKCRWGR